MIPSYHAGYVVDASVLVKWFKEEEGRDRALALRQLHTSRKSAIFISELTFLEILNAIRYSPKSSEEDGAEALHVLRNLRLQVRSIEFDLLRKANAIARAYKTTIYVALAEQLGYSLITDDEVMVKKLKGHRIVVPIREL